MGWKNYDIILWSVFHLRFAVSCQSVRRATPFTRIAILTRRWNRRVSPFTLMAPSRVKNGSRTSGRSFSGCATEGCEVTGWLYFISPLLVLYLIVTFLQVSYLTWSFSSGPITYRFTSPHANFIYPPFFPFSCVIFSHTLTFFYSSEISVEISAVTYDNSSLCLYTHIFHRKLLHWYVIVHYRP